MTERPTCRTCGGSGWITLHSPNGPASATPCTDCGEAQVLGQGKAPEIKRR